MDTDGNLAALRQYEREQDKQELAREYLLEEVKTSLKEIRELVVYIRSCEEDSYYDFSDEINEWLQEAIE